VLITPLTTKPFFGHLRQQLSYANFLRKKNSSRKTVWPYYKLFPHLCLFSLTHSPIRFLANKYDVCNKVPVILGRVKQSED
jgi:hypothetical protein